MSMMKAVAGKREEKILSEKMSDREMYLLKALLNLLLYVGSTKGNEGVKNLFFTSAGNPPARLPFNIPINMG